MSDEYPKNVWNVIKKIVTMMRKQKGDYSIIVQTPIMILGYTITLSIGPGSDPLDGHHCQNIGSWWGPEDGTSRVSLNFIYRHEGPLCEDSKRFRKHNVQSLKQIMRLTIESIDKLVAYELKKAGKKTKKRIR